MEYEPLSDNPNMADLVDFLHATVSDIGQMETDIEYCNEDEWAMREIVDSHMPRLMTSCSAAVVVLERLIDYAFLKEDLAELTD